MAMVTSDMRGWNYDRAREKFNERMEDVLRSSTYKTLHGVDMYMLHVNHTNYKKMVKAERLITPLGCSTRNNFVDCGVFMMRHMETYKGDGDCCGLSREGSEQINELIDLRHKYIAKILFCRLQP
ncbi:ulp1 protease family, C-terminal catalytic domain-containing protein, partial [Tanacetum coccineum]